MAANKPQKSGSDDILYVILLIGVVFFAIGLIMLGHPEKLVPKEHYVNEILSYSDKTINRTRELHFSLLQNLAVSSKERLKNIEKSLVKEAEIEKTSIEQAKKKGKSVFTLIFTKSNKSYLQHYIKSFMLLMQFTLTRAEIFFFYIMSLIVETEYITIAIIFVLLFLPILTLFYENFLKRKSDEKHIMALLNLFLHSVKDNLGFVQEHPVAGKNLIDIDKLRDYVNKALKGKVKPDKRIKDLYKDENFRDYIYSMGSVIVFMKKAVISKNGKLVGANYGYPASISGHHNPDFRYGLLVHSLAAAYIASRSAYLDGINDIKTLLSVFYAGLAHDAGKIRLYRKIIGKPEIIEAQDALDGDKHVKEKKREAEKQKERWETLENNPVSQDIQMKVFLAKIKAVMPDKKLTESYVKEADHRAVESELRYTALPKKERHSFFRKAITGIFKKEKRFNSFDEDMIGVVFNSDGKKRLFLLATFATRLAKFIKKNIKDKDLNLKLPLMPKAINKCKYSKDKAYPFTYAVSQYLYEAGYINLLDNPKADIVGLYDAVFKRQNGQEIDYTAGWFIDEFERFCSDFGLKPEITEDGVEIVEIEQRIKKENFIDKMELKEKTESNTDDKKEISRAVGDDTETEEDEEQKILNDIEEIVAERKQKQEPEEESPLLPTHSVGNKGEEEKDKKEQEEDEVKSKKQEVLEAVSEFTKEEEEKEEQEKKEKLDRLGIRNCFRVMKNGNDIAKLKNIDGLSKEQFERLKKDITKKYGNKCALCVRELGESEKRFFGVYELEDIEVNGEKKKKVVLTDVELLCNNCYMLKSLTLEKFKTGRNSNFYTNVMNKRLSLNLTENEFETYLEQEEKARMEVEKDIKQIDYKYLIDNGYM